MHHDEGSIQEPQLRISKKVLPYLTVIVLLATALALRLCVFKFQSNDYKLCLVPWYNYIHTHGFSAFKDNFSNYNLPYLYLLYIANMLHLHTLVAVKLISGIFDLILALSVYKVLRLITQKTALSLIASASILFLPTVLFNSAIWGQCDSIYTSLLIFSLYSVLKNRPKLAWALWGLALCFKLQAIFFLPFLTYIWLTRKRDAWWTPIVVVPIFFAPFIPALIAGRSFKSILEIYKDQGTVTGSITQNAANFYQWIGESMAPYFNKGGVFLALGLVTILIMAAALYLSRQIKNETYLGLLLAILLVVPFFLPQMHDRYYYPAEIVVYILAVAKPVFAPLLVSVQLVGFFSYLPFLTQTSPLPMTILALIQIINIGAILLYIFPKRAHEEVESLKTW